MPKAIDVHDMNTAVHNLYEIKSKPQTVAKAFRELTQLDYFEDHFRVVELWDFINENTEYLGEYNIHTQMSGSLWWTNRILNHGVNVKWYNGTVYNVVESVRLY
jgi:hypothetical protein